MTMFDDFIAKNALLEADLWQIIEDHDLLEKHGWIEDCMMRDFASKLENEYPQFKGDIVYIMDKLYVACLKSLALKSTLYEAQTKKENSELKLRIKTLEQDNASLRSRLAAALAAFLERLELNL